jgi:homoserine kinase
VIVRVAESGLGIDIAGEGAETLPRDERHLLVRSMRTAFEVLGGQPRGLEVVCANRIPHGRGLGSSSAAICAGLIAARAVTTGGEARLGDAALLELASEIEGHPDNVAACLLGGFTVAWSDAGSVRAIRLEPAETVVPVVFVPAQPLLTETARGLLPRTVPHVDAAVNAGRAALLVEALTRRPDLLLPATEDRLHQEYRAPAMADSVQLVSRLRADGVPAVISGAGPTVLPSKLTVRYLETAVGALRILRDDMPIVATLPPPHRAASYGYVHTGRDPATAAIATWAQRADVPLVDLAAVVGDHVLSGRGNPDGMHWGWEGHRLVGEAMARRLAALAAGGRTDPTR